MTFSLFWVPAGMRLCVDHHQRRVFCSLTYLLSAFIFRSQFSLVFPLFKVRSQKRKQCKTQASNANKIFKSGALSLKSLKGKAIHKCQAGRQALRHHWCRSSFNKMRAATSPPPDPILLCSKQLQKWQRNKHLLSQHPAAVPTSTSTLLSLAP